MRGCLVPLVHTRLLNAPSSSTASEQHFSAPRIAGLLARVDLLPEVTEHVRLARDLRDSGFASADLAAMLRSGELQHLRRGAYATRPMSSAADAHRLLVAGTLPLLCSTSVVSHQSACLLHELPWWSDSCSRVHVTRSKPSGGRRDPLVHVHPALLEPYDQVTIDGTPVTSLARTVADCLRTLPYPRAVAVADAALRIDRKSVV